MSRAILSRYDDPVDLIWLACAARLGYEVRRDDAVYASYDGGHVLTVARSAELDADDSLAQIVFHELCHALVASDADRGAPDWGLDNTSERDLVWEHACHRLQAALADAHGLRAFMAATTEWRPYWDALPADPLAPGDDPAIALAAAGFARARRPPWRDPLEAALSATAAVAAAVRAHAPDGSLWRLTEPTHPLGGALGPPDTRCGGCAWRHLGGPGRLVDRCRQHRPTVRPPGSSARFLVAPRVDPSWRGCARWEPPLTDASCAPCGACCRQGFDLVPIPARAPLVRAHPELVVRDALGHHLPRPDGFCVALERGPGDGPPYRCRVYELRPPSCADFEVGGDHCLDARRRVGLSR